MTARRQSGSVAVELSEIRNRAAQLWLLGETPLISHNFSVKAQRELLSPRGKAAKKKSGAPKHDPIREFRESVYRMETGPTLCGFPVSGIKKSAVSAAKEVGEMPGTTIQKLLYVEADEGLLVSLYGMPKIFAAMTRLSGPNGAADIRFRAIFPQWAVCVDVRWLEPKLNAKTVVDLFSAAGQIVGLGDWRCEKGGIFGRFTVADPENDQIKELQTKDREAQEAALETPEEFSSETRELTEWWKAEIVERGLNV